MKIFTISIQPKYTLTPCQKMLDEENRGLIGWHRFSTCPDCQHTPAGAELWGENGHLQGRLREMPTPEDIPDMVRRFSTGRSTAAFIFKDHGFTYRAR